MSEQKRMVKVVKAEVYSRVVGYYRPIQDWNRGKKEEYGDRHQMTAKDLCLPAKEISLPSPSCEDKICRVG